MSSAAVVIGALRVNMICQTGNISTSICCNCLVKHYQISPSKSGYKICDVCVILNVQRTLVITTLFVTKDFGVKSNLLL